MTRFVLDASIVFTWCFPDEDAQKAQKISERIASGDQPAVPAFWRHKVLNALLVGEKRKRLTSNLIETFINDWSGCQLKSTARRRERFFVRREIFAENTD